MEEFEPKREIKNWRGGGGASWQREKSRVRNIHPSMNVETELH